MLTIFFILLGIVVTLGILSFFAPKTYAVERSVHINKPKNEVFNYLRLLENMDNWGPWAKKDPEMEKKLTGVDGQVGAISYWNGNKEVGEGEQEITKIIEGERIESQLRFLKPFKSSSNGYLSTEEDGTGTTVKWGFTGEMKPPMNIIMLIMNMEKSVGPEFEKGLKDLKEILETS